MKIKGKDLKAGMVLEIGQGISYEITEVGLPFVADGTVRVMCRYLYYPIVVREEEMVNVVN